MQCPPPPVTPNKRAQQRTALRTDTFFSPAFPFSLITSVAFFLVAARPSALACAELAAKECRLVRLMGSLENTTASMVPDLRMARESNLRMESHTTKDDIFCGIACRSRGKGEERGRARGG